MTMIVLFTKKNCPHCDRAKQTLCFEGTPFTVVEVETKNEISNPYLRALCHDMKTFPIIFQKVGQDEYKLIGGADELEEHLLVADSE